MVDKPDHRETARRIVALVARDVAELPDRTSPPDEPMLLLVTENELIELVDYHFTAALAAERAKALEEAAQMLIRASDHYENYAAKHHDVDGDRAQLQAHTCRSQAASVRALIPAPTEKDG